MDSRHLAQGWLGPTLAAAMAVGCGSVLNPAFVNTFQGGVVPLTPGPSADFVLVRGLNETGQRAEFTVTIEREVLELDDEGRPIFDEQGNPVTRPMRQTIRMLAEATGPANETGVLFSCKESPVNIVGLGENLLPTDAGVFVGGGGAGGATGIGIPATDVPPLSREAGHFSCGDTIIYRAFLSAGEPGGIALQSLLLPGSEQPSEFTGPSTFENLEAFLESQIVEELP